VTERICKFTASEWRHWSTCIRLAKARHFGVLGGRLPREHSVADHALAHVLTEDDEYLADLVGVGGAGVSPVFFLSSHVDQQRVTNV
jgi:hypothetical protein